MRNPIAKAVTKLRQKVKPSGKNYIRRKIYNRETKKLIEQAISLKNVDDDIVIGNPKEIMSLAAIEAQLENASEH